MRFDPRPLGHLVVFALALIPGCDRTVAAGDPCVELGEVKCIDAKTGGFCIDGKYEALACEGATGCMNVGTKASCVHQNYAVGEPCFEENEPECTGDGTAMIKCENSRWVKVNDCNGKLGCVANAKGAKCDLGATHAGDDCTPDNEGNASCNEEGDALLLCKDGKMMVESTCKGMHGCRQKGKTIECNSQIADLDDPCDRKFYDGKFACTPDKKMRLICKDGTFVKEQDCACNVMIDDVTCKG